MSSLLQELNDDAAALNDRVLNSLVQISNGQRGIGAGAIWQSDGLIVTNAHVVLGRRGQVSNDLTVTLRDGHEYPARIIAYDAERDLAALRIDASSLTPIEIGDSLRLHAGDLVFAMGFPWGIRGGATSGVVIGAGTELPELGDSRHEWIAASLHLRPGHSGGPLVDSYGRVVGINTLMNGPDVGVAIPVHVASEFIKAVTVGQSHPSPLATVTL